MNGYRCPGCGHYIGLICAGDKPGLYRCPRTRRVYGPQVPIKRIAPKKPATPETKT